MPDVNNEHGPCADHSCFDMAERRPYSEGDDVLVEVCVVCGRVRHETDGARPMAWFHDPTNPTGHRYAWQPSGNDPNKPTVWRHPDTLDAGALSDA